MSTDFDLLPIYDPILKDRNDILSDVWVGAFSRMMETLISFMGQFGFFLPNLTTAQRDEIQQPINGQLIYNTTVDAPQFYQSSSSSWRTVLFS